MTAVTANVRSRMEHSCNWRCCFGCKDSVQEPRENHTPSDEEQNRRIQEVRERAVPPLNVLSEPEEDLPPRRGSGELQIEATHVRIHYTPQSTPDDSPRAVRPADVEIEEI